MEMWDCFGELPDDEFNRLTRDRKLYQQSLVAGRNSEIEFVARAPMVPMPAQPYAARAG